MTSNIKAVKPSLILKIEFNITIIIKNNSILNFNCFIASHSCLLL